MITWKTLLLWPMILYDQLGCGRSDQPDSLQRIFAGMGTQVYLTM